MTSIIFDGIDLSKIDDTPDIPPRHHAIGIEEFDDHYVLRDMIYSTRPVKSLDIAITKGLLDRGAAKTQNNWIQYGFDTGWSLPSAPVLLRIIGKLWQYHNTDLGSRIINDFEQNFRDGILTSTRMMYLPEHITHIRHCHGTPGVYELRANLVGEDGFLARGHEPITDAIFDISNIEYVSDVFWTVFGKNPYLLRAPAGSNINANLTISNKDMLIINLAEALDKPMPAYGIKVKK